MRASKNGFGLVQILVASAALGALALVASSLMDRINKSSRGANLQGIAQNVETHIRGALQNKVALGNTRSATADLNTCLTDAQARQTARSSGLPLTAGCIFSGPQPLSLRNADNLVLSVGGASQALADDGTACVPAAGNFSCQWQTSAATWERVGSGAGAVDAEEIRLRVLLSWVAPPGMAATQNFVMKPKVIDVTVPRHYFDASNLPVTPQQMCLDLGGTWNSAGAPRCILVPPGAVMAFVTACPSGWAAANGSSGRPDLRGRNVIGSGGTPVSQASASGLQTLSVANMPAHNHAGSNAAPAGDHSHSYSQWTPAGDTSLGLVNSPTVANTERGVNSGGGSTSGAGSHSHSLNIATQGGGQAFSVMDPYTVLNYCVKL